MIPAGQSGKLIAKVHTRPTQDMKMRKAVSVATDSPDLPSFRLTVSFEVRAAIKVLPRAQLNIRGVVGKVAVSQLLLRRTDGESLEVTGVKVGEPGIELDITEVEPDDELQRGLQPEKGDLWVKATVTNEAEVGNRSARIWLTTNHPDMPELEVPVVVRIRPLIEVRPAALQLFVQEHGGGPRGTVFRINHNGSERFEITDIRVADTNLIEASATAEGARPVHTIRVELPDTLTHEYVSTQKKTNIVIATSDPDVPEITVPVTVTARRPVTRPVRTRSRIQPKSGGQPVLLPVPTGTVNPG